MTNITKEVQFWYPYFLLNSGRVLMNLKRQFFICLLTPAFLTACTSIQPTYTATGNPGYRINCGGVFGDGDLGSCYQSAGEACQSQGYRIMQSGVSSMIVECRSEAHTQRDQAATEIR